MSNLTPLKAVAVRQAMKWIATIAPHLPDNLILSLLKPQINYIKYPDGIDFVNSIILQAKRYFAKASEVCRNRMAVNLFANYSLLSGEKRNDFIAREGLGPPLLYVISPTMRCNLTCYGCYSANYNKNDDLDFETIDRVITEGKEYGIYFVVISGGEPFIRDDILKIFEKHNDVFFQVFTNSTMIAKKKLTKNIAELGNVLPCISVEGFEKETDERRGKGTFKTIISVMEELRERGAAYGFSVTATRQNNELIVSDEFVDFFVDKGCFLGWYFNYMPIGRNPDVDLMPTPEQRNYRRKRIIEMRKTKPIVLADFWNDGTSVGGCISGRVYLHINNRGDVEPCVFSQFSVDNIKGKSLCEVWKSPFFNELRARQRGMKNKLRPCMIIDRPNVLREVVSHACARPTQQGGEATLTKLAPALDEYARRYAEIAEDAWEKEYGEERETKKEEHSASESGEATMEAESKGV